MTLFTSQGYAIMKTLSAAFLFLITGSLAIGQTKIDSLDIEIIISCDFGSEVDEKGNVIIDPVEIMPRFVVSYDSIKEFIKHNLNWTQGHKTISGKSFVEFIVLEDGSITAVKVIKGLCESCDKAAVEVIKKLPNFLPATDSNGQPIKAKMILPIQFDI